MQVTLYSNFSKRRNSTKQPTTGGVVKDVKLKGECSYTRPSFFLADATEYTYLQAWGNYYFIDERLYDINGASYVNCSIDVRASFKTEILATSAFVKYSSSDYSLKIVDNRVVPLVEQRVGVSDEATDFSTTESYIITCIGQDGGVVNYYTGYTGLIDIVESLLSKTSSWWQTIFVSLEDALSCLVSVRAVPINSLSTGVSRQVYLGGLDLEIGTLPTLTDVRPGYYTDNFYLTINRTYSDFRKCSKYTTLFLYLPFVGKVELSADDFVGSEGVSIKLVANAMTGNIIYRVGNDDGDIVGVYNGTFGRQIPISNIQLTNVAQSLGQIAGAVAIGGGLLGLGEAGVALGGGLTLSAGASAISSGVGAFTSFMKHSATMIGGYSGGYGEDINTHIYLSVDEQPTRIEPSNLTELYGNPCSKVRQISGLTGYVETLGFSIDINETDEIKRMINEAMDSGTYLE